MLVRGEIEGRTFPQLLLPLSDHRVSVRLDGRCLIRSRIRADHGSSLVFCPHRSFDAREAESVRGVAVHRHARDRECVRRVIDQENSLQARDESRERPPSASARARELEVRDPGDVAVPKRDQTGRRRTADERTADVVVGATGSWRTWARRSRKPSGRCCGWRLRPKIALDGKTGMRLPMHLAKILGGLRRGRGNRTAPVHDQDATKA